MAKDERYSALSREITAGEWEEALAALEANGLENGFQQEFKTANRYYRPDFTDREKPLPGHPRLRYLREFSSFDRRVLSSSISQSFSRPIS